MKTTFNYHNNRRGQALIEFALVLPILLLIMAGILEFGRVLVAFSSASDAHRDALRNAEVIGFSGGGLPPYADCEGIRAEATNTFAITDPTSGDRVTIEYFTAESFNAGTGTFDFTIKCLQTYANTNSTTTPIDNPDIVITGGNPATDIDKSAEDIPGYLENGDILRVTTLNRIELITPVIQAIVPDITLTFVGQRTILKNIELCTEGGGGLDEDCDGLRDQWEIDNFDDVNDETDLDKHDAFQDHDGDGCSNGCEELRGETLPCLSPEDADSDDDGLLDGEELFFTRTDPCEIDTDGDSLEDGAEANDNSGNIDDKETRTPPNDDPALPTYNFVVDFESAPDINDGAHTFDSDPLNPDGDGDGLLDGEEVLGQLASAPFTVFGVTDPNDPDTDDDGIDDFTEVTGSVVPNVTINGVTQTRVWPSDPTSWDGDGDGLSDPVEISGSANIFNGVPKPTDPSNPDTDGDDHVDNPGIEGLNDGEEANALFGKADIMIDPGTGPEPYTISGPLNPTEKDTDGDGIEDQDELCLTVSGCQQRYGQDHMNRADVPDGSTNYYDLDPTNPDTDGDGIRDGDELTFTTNPLVADADSDNDGLPDPWEDFYFASDYTTCSDFSDCGDTDTSNDADPADPNNAGGPLDIYLRFEPGDDPDGDGADNGEELNAGTNPANPDTDGDGLDDGQEIITGTNVYALTVNGVVVDPAFSVPAAQLDPRNPDVDGDGLLDGEEAEGFVYNAMLIFTNPVDSDTDDDNVVDGDEIVGGSKSFGIACQTPDPISYTTSPIWLDTDQDGLGDWVEPNLRNTIPNVADSDCDTILDGEEWGGFDITLNTLGGTVTITTNPTLADTDGDTLSDSDERDGILSADGVNTYFSDPRFADTDLDGIDDNVEINTLRTLSYSNNMSTVMVSYTTDPDDGDTDGDGLLDGLEVLGGSFCNVTVLISNPTDIDTDDDGLLDGREACNFQSDPKDDDTDDDTLIDGFEVGELTGNADVDSVDPVDPATGDIPIYDLRISGVTKSGFPAHLLSDPTLADTDGDGIDDNDEVDETFTGAFPRVTDPGDADTDDDFVNDGAEQLAASPTDPTDPNPTIIIRNMTDFEPLGNTARCVATFTVELVGDSANRTDDIVLDISTFGSGEGHAANPTALKGSGPTDDFEQADGTDDESPCGGGSVRTNIPFDDDSATGGTNNDGQITFTGPGDSTVKEAFINVIYNGDNVEPELDDFLIVELANNTPGTPPDLTLADVNGLGAGTAKGTITDQIVVIPPGPPNNAPTISLSQSAISIPAGGGPATVTVTANDADGDPLTFSVVPDSCGPCQVFGTMINGDTELEITLRNTASPGDMQTITVTVEDGTDSASATIDVTVT